MQQCASLNRTLRACVIRRTQTTSLLPSRKWRGCCFSFRFPFKISMIYWVKWKFVRLAHGPPRCTASWSQGCSWRPSSPCPPRCCWGPELQCWARNSITIFMKHATKTGSTLMQQVNIWSVCVLQLILWWYGWCSVHYLRRKHQRSTFSTHLLQSDCLFSNHIIVNKETCLIISMICSFRIDLIWSDCEPVTNNTALCVLLIFFFVNVIFA